MHSFLSHSDLYVFANKHHVPTSESEMSPYTDSAVWHLIMHSFAVVILFSYLRIAAVAANCKKKINK